MGYTKKVLEILDNWADQNERDYAAMVSHNLKVLTRDLKEVVETAEDSAFKAGKDSVLYETKHQPNCWHCHGIEDHGITHITEYRDNSNRRLSAPMAVPYNYCGCCGRKLNK